MAKGTNRRKKIIRSASPTVLRSSKPENKTENKTKQKATAQDRTNLEKSGAKSASKSNLNRFRDNKTSDFQSKPIGMKFNSQIVFVTALSLLLGIGLGFGLGGGANRAGSSSVVENAIDELTRNAPGEVNRETLERAAIEGALKASGDQWANYFPSAAVAKLQDRNANILTGIGVTLTKARSGAVEIAQVVKDSTAESAGLQSGDQLLEVNETDVQGASLTTVVALIRAEIGNELQLRILRGSEKLAFQVATERVNLSTVEGAQIDNGIAYLAVSNFAVGTADEAKRVLVKLNSNSGIILDLRDNPGGLVEEAVKLAEIFIEKGTIVSYKVAGEERIFNARNINPNRAPLVVMINRGTSSAAEIFAAAIQDRNRGVVIGERSYGKGSVQEFITLDDGSKLELTVALYLTPSGKTIDGVGVTPDLVVKKSELNLKALQILGGLAELNNPIKR